MTSKSFSVFSTIASKVSAPLLVRLGSAVMGLFITVLISRSYGTDTLGVVSLTNKIYQVLLMISLFGFRELIIRQTSIFQSQKRLSDSFDLLSNAVVCGLSMAAIIVLSLYLSIDWLSTNVFEEPRLSVFLGVFVFALPLAVLSKYASFSLIGTKRITKSLLIDGFVSNVVIITALLAIYFLDLGVSLKQLALIYIASRVLSVIVALGFFKELKIRIQKFKYNGNILREGRPFFGLSIVSVISANLDVIVVGAFFDTHQVALYAIASRVALLLTLLMHVIDYILAPDIAQLFAQRKISQIKAKVRQFVLFALMGASMFVLVQVLFGSYILNVWGKDFAAGHQVLIILSLGVGIQFATAPFGTLFKMSGKESLLFKIQLWTTVGYVALLILLTINFGLTEAAIAYACYRATAGIILAVYASQFLKKLQVKEL